MGEKGWLAGWGEGRRGGRGGGGRGGQGGAWEEGGGGRGGALVLCFWDVTSLLLAGGVVLSGQALDDSDEIERSIMRAVTDSGSELMFSNEPSRAGVNNLLNIYKAITDIQDQDSKDRHSGSEMRIRNTSGYY